VKEEKDIIMCVAGCRTRKVT